MSPHPAPLHWLMLRVLRHLLALVVAAMGVKLAEIRARRDALPEGHVRRARLEAEMRRLARLRRLAADPTLLEDAAFRGRAAEVARMWADAGRRAMVRRWIHPTPLVRLRGAVPPAAEGAEAGRCTAGIAVA